MNRATLVASILLLTASCSRSLSFNFAFQSSDGGSNQQDLAVTQNDLAMSQDDLAPPDLGIGDLAHALDGSTPDLQSVADLRVVKDLVTLPDLTTVSLLGAACNPSDFVPCGIVDQLECLTFFKIQSSNETTTIADGYCTKPCDRDEDCIAMKGLCRQLGASGYKCMPACDGSCARDNYTCCFHCPDGPDCIAGAVCAPPAAPDYNSCIVANP